MKYLTYLWNVRYFILSLSLTSVGYAWDVIFAMNHFEKHSWIAVLMFFQLRLSYILLPYMQDKNMGEPKKKKSSWLDKQLSKLTFSNVMIGILFASLMIPASLGISDQFLGKMINNIKAEPEKPVKPELDSSLENDIAIERYHVYANIDAIKSQAKLDELLQKKATYRDNKNKYDTDVVDYPKKLEEYRKYKAEKSTTWLLDIIMLCIGFIITTSLDIMSGYSSKKGAETFNNGRFTLKINDFESIPFVVESNPAFKVKPETIILDEQKDKDVIDEIKQGGVIPEGVGYKVPETPEPSKLPVTEPVTPATKETYFK